MAVARNGINGNFRGKVGSVVGVELNGQQVLRGIPRKRTSLPTEKELLNRLKFAVSQKWLEPLTDFLRIGFKGYQPTYQGFVAAKSYNQKNALESDGNGGFLINPELALVSWGTQPLPLTTNISCKENQELIYEWSTEYKGEYNDQAMLVAYDIENGRVFYNAGAAKRNCGTAKLKLEQHYAGRIFHLYLAFIADDRSSKSNSTYLGSVVVI